MPGCQAKKRKGPAAVCGARFPAASVERSEADYPSPAEGREATESVRRAGAEREARVSVVRGPSVQSLEGQPACWLTAPGAKRSTKLDARTMGIPLTGGGVVGLATRTAARVHRGADSPGGGDAPAFARGRCAQDRRRDPSTILPPEDARAPLKEAGARARSGVGEEADEFPCCPRGVDPRRGQMTPVGCGIGDRVKRLWCEPGCVVQTPHPTTQDRPQYNTPYNTGLTGADQASGADVFRCPRRRPVGVRVAALVTSKITSSLPLR